MEYFKKCIESVIKLNPYEIIIVDDCSSDEDVVSYAKSTGCIYYKTQTQSGLDGTPFNLGVQKATGDYICRVDHDDILLELPTQMKCDMHFGNLDRVNVPNKLRIEDLILEPRAIFNAMVIKRELLLKHPMATDKNVYTETLLMMTLLKHGYSYDHHERVNYIYNDCPTSVQNTLSYFEHRLKHMQTVARFCYLEQIDPDLSIRYLELAMYHMRYGANAPKILYKERIKEIHQQKKDSKK